MSSVHSKISDDDFNKEACKDNHIHNTTVVTNNNNHRHENDDKAFEINKEDQIESLDEEDKEEEEDDEETELINYDSLGNHDSDLINTGGRYSTDNPNSGIRRGSSASITSTAASTGHRFTSTTTSHRKKSSVVTRGMDFIRRMRWKSPNDLHHLHHHPHAAPTVAAGANRRLSQPDFDQLESYIHWRSSWSTQTSPRGSIDNSSIPDNLMMTSTSTTSTTSTTNSLPPIQEYQNRLTRALHTPTRFLPQHQAVITTNADGTILLFNDIASLCFGIDKSYIGKSVLTSILEDPFCKQITTILGRRKKSICEQQQSDNKGLVLVCGTIIPIVKANGVKSVASLWLKEKKTDSHGDHIYIWIFEEIYDTSLSVYVDSECTIRRVLGTMIDIYNYKEKDIVGKPVNCLVPALSKEKRDDNLEKIDRLKFFGSQSSCGIYFPVILNLNRHVAMGDDDLASFVVKITSLPTITGYMTIDTTTGYVMALNPVPAKYLFGYSVSTIIEEKKIPYKDLMRQLPFLVNHLATGSGTMTSAMCKKLLEERFGGEEKEESVIYVVHRDGSQFEVELSLKRDKTNTNLVSVYITYDRLDAVSKYQKRSSSNKESSASSVLLNKTKQRIQQIISDNNDQGLLVSPIITEKNTKQQDAVDPLVQLPPVATTAIVEEKKQSPPRRPVVRTSRISSFGNVDEHRKLFPTSAFPAVTSQDEVSPTPVTASSASPTYVEQKRHPLDDYVILDILGQGTYGMAKLAYRKDDPSQKKLVIKYIIKSKIIVDSWIRDRQLGSIPMEIHILRTLQKYPHVNCCRLVTSSEDEDYYYIVMELLGDGMDLFDYIEMNKSMSEIEIKRIFFQVANAVKHLHQHRIVHRDIKDENIILDEEGTVHLIDFGCATYYKKDRKFDTFTGTLEYCAPEVLKGKPYEGPPQDIWASGILLFTLIYRENPFYNIDEIMERELRVPYILSEGSLDLIKKMLERDIEKRINIDQVLEHPWFHSITNMTKL